MMCIHDDLARALETLKLLGPCEQFDFLVSASLETHGYFKTPRHSDNRDPQTVEIKAHGLFADGADLCEAIRNWRLIASRRVNVQRQVDKAEYVLRQPPGHNSSDIIRKACQTILNDGRADGIRNAARSTLAELDATG